MTLTEICTTLAEAHKNSTQGKWQRGQTSHHTVTEKRYKIAEFHHACDAEFCDKAHELLPKLLATIAQLSAFEQKPIDMVLHCPACGLQHIDAQEITDVAALMSEVTWWNPPHRSHLCHSCGHIWRPADVPTNGVAVVKTKGKADGYITSKRKMK